MARRVNTKFLFTLIAVLVLAVTVSFGIYWWRNLYYNNPTRLIAAAKKALAAQNVDAAISYYQRAAVAAEREHLPSAAQISLDIGDLYFNHTSSNPERFFTAMRSWIAVVQINPRFLPAQLRLLKAYWSIAKRGGQRSDWQSLQRTASAVIGLDPKYARAWRLRAQAQLGLLQGLSSITKANFSQAIHDLKQACKLAPTKSKSFRILAAIYDAQATGELRLNLIGPKRAAILRAKALKLVQGFVHSYPKNAHGWLALAAVYQNQPKSAAEYTAALQHAIHLAPNDSQVILSNVDYMINKGEPSKKIIAVMNHLIATSKNKMKYYLLLGNYQLTTGQTKAAVDSLMAGLHHPAPGQGITPLINQHRRLAINQLLTDAYLQFAQNTAPGSPERKNYVLHAADSLRWVKQHEPLSPWVTLYTGRLRFMQGRPESALRWLKKAAAVLTPGKKADILLWFRDHQWQSQVYTSLNQTGAALSQLNQISAVVHGQPLVLIDQAALTLAQDPAGALADAQEVLKAVPGNMAAIALEARALAALNRIPQLRKLLAGVNTDQNLQLALLKGRLAWLDGHYHAAAAIMKPWLKELPGDSRVVLLTYAALAKLNERAKAVNLFRTAIKSSPDNIQFLVLSDVLSQPHGTMPQIKFAGAGSDVLSIVMSGEASKNAQLHAIQRIQQPFLRDITLFNYYLGSGNQAAARQALAAAAKLKPSDGRVINAEFSLALSTKDYTRASELATQAADANLDGVDGATYRARLAIARKDPGNAVKILKTALDNHPYNTSLETYYGQALLMSGNVKTGIQTLRKALASSPDDIAAIKALVRYNLASPSVIRIEDAISLVNQGLAYQPLDSQLNQWNDSLQDLYGPPAPAIARRKKILASDPGNVQNIMRLGLLYARAKEAAKGIALIKKAYKSHPDSLDLAEELGSLYTATQEYSAAQNLYGRLAESKNRKTALAMRLLLGDLYASQGNLAQAKELYVSALKMEPKGSQVAQRRLGDLYFNSKHYNKALTYYAPLYKARPHDRTVLLRYIETLIRAGHTTKGLAMLNTDVFPLDAHDEAGLELKGLALRRQGHFRQALKALNLALALNPRDILALESRAECRMSIPGENLNKALADLNRITALDPSDLQPRLQTAAIYRQQGHNALAVQEYRAILKKVSPGNPQIQQIYAGLLLSLSANYLKLSPNNTSGYAASLRTINPVVRLTKLLTPLTAEHPHKPVWWMLSARLNLLLGHKNRAMAMARKAYLADNRGSLGAADYGQVLNAGGDPGRAVSVSTKALALAPDFVPLYLVRAQANVNLKRWQPGADDYAKAMGLSLSDPAVFLDIATSFVAAYKSPDFAAIAQKTVADFVAAHHSSNPVESSALEAILAFNEGRYPDALAAAQAALAKKSVPVLQSEMLRTAALSAYELKQYATAEKYYRSILVISPSDANVLNNLAYLLAVKMKKPAEGLPFAERANRLEARIQGGGLYCDDSNLLDTLGWSRYLTRDYSGAYDALHRALRFNPPATAYYHLARVLLAQNRRSDAISILKKGIVLAKKDGSDILGRAQKLLKELESQPSAGQ